MALQTRRTVPVHRRLYINDLVQRNRPLHIDLASATKTSRPIISPQLHWVAYSGIGYYSADVLASLLGLYTAVPLAIEHIEQ